jgi:hypothetical protein
MMPPAPSGVFTGTHFITKAHIMPGLSMIQKGDPNMIPPFTAPPMAPGAPMPMPTAGAFFPAPENSTTPESIVPPAGDMATSSTSTTADAASSSTTTTALAAEATAADDAEAAPGLPAAEAGAGDVSAPPAGDEASSSSSTTSSAAAESTDAEAEAGADPASNADESVTPAAQVEAAIETTIDITSLSMSNSGVLGVDANLEKRAPRGARRRFVLPSQGL